MKYYFCLYSNEAYEKPRKALLNLAQKSKIFSKIFEFDKSFLIDTDFYKDNIGILGDPESKGDGWCLWKPYIIKEVMNQINPGDVLIYMDSSDTFFSEFHKFIINHFIHNDFLLVKTGNNLNRTYTKRDTFFYMGCDSPKYWNSIQLEAGIIGLKKTTETEFFLDEYLKTCSIPEIIKGLPNISGLKNFPDYVDHRYDQSILSNLRTKYNISDNPDVMQYAECNMWEALDDTSEFNRKIDLIRSKCNRNSYNFWLKEYLSYLIPINQ